MQTAYSSCNSPDIVQNFKRKVFSLADRTRHCVVCVSVCFKVFDTDRDGRLSRTELTNMVEAMLAIRKENKTRSKLVSLITRLMSVEISYITSHNKQMFEMGLRVTSV